MSIIAWIVLGAIAGWLASLIMRTNSSQGIFGDIIIGILGALLGGWITSLFGTAGVTGFNLASIAVAVLGSVVLIAIVRMFRGDAAIQS